MVFIKCSLIKNGDKEKVDFNGNEMDYLNDLGRTKKKAQIYSIKFFSSVVVGCSVFEE